MCGRFVGRSHLFYSCSSAESDETSINLFSCVAFVWLVMTVVRVSLLSYYCVFGNMLMFHPGLLLLSQIISRAVVKVVIPTDRYVTKIKPHNTLKLCGCVTLLCSLRAPGSIHVLSRRNNKLFCIQCYFSYSYLTPL